jgi:hypothetical protein
VAPPRRSGRFTDSADSSTLSSVVRPGLSRWRRGALPALLAGILPLLAAAPVSACVGTNCMTIWSTADGGGALTIDWDFSGRSVLQTYPAVCFGGECLYTNQDPGFLAQGGAPPDGFFSLASGTVVEIEIVAADAAASVKINGVSLAHPGDHARLGSAGTLHTHPSWQLTLPEGIEGDFPLAFVLRAASPLYGDSAVFSVRLTNRPPPPTETPTAAPPTDSPTPTATPPPPCAGDCDGDGIVTVAELVGGVASALGGAAPCAALDGNGDGHATIGELIAAVGAALAGCPALATPTETPAASLAAIQATIFSPRCAIPSCHDRASAVGDLNLEADISYDALVGVAPTVEAARAAGMLRVDPGHPDNSFLLSKLAGPPPGQGSRMPLSEAPLGDAEMALIRAWIVAGASR